MTKIERGIFFRRSLTSQQREKRLLRVNESAFAFALCLAVLATVLPTSLHASETDQSIDRLIPFNIPQQRADLALLEFAEQADLTLAVRPEEVDDIQANALVGAYRIAEGIEQLLANTGLDPVLQNEMVLNVRYERQINADEQGDTMEPKKAGFMAALVAVFAGTGANAQTDSDADRSLEEIVVTGVRGAPRSISDSPIPIDVFSAEMLERIPATGGLFEQLRYNVPSLNYPQRAGGGTATFIASAGLRGLNPDQTLVLVNGKRRHKTSLINTSTGLFSGSAGVDLNMIPNSAIERIEVLRDGAAAQYGSDAIAGVVNIILREDSAGGFVTGTYGENFDRGDGEFYNAGANVGFPLGGDGFLNLSFDYRTNKGSERANPVPIPTVPGEPFRFYPDVDNGDGTFSVDPRESLVNRTVRNYGEYPSDRQSFAVNTGYDLGNVELYGFGTYTKRSSTLFFTFRRPRDGRNNGEIFPNGFIPEEEIREDDYEGIIGLRGTAFDFDWDLSGGYGRNNADWHNNLGANASLAELSPTSFYLGAFDVKESYAQFDATRAYDVSVGELQVSFGAAFRNEKFEISEGDPEGTITYDGPLLVLPTDPRGAQGFPAFGPDDVNSVSRDNVGVYGELGWQASSALFISAAGRYEDYSDSSGDQAIFKLAGRYDPTDWLGVRASFNTGFRAPSVQQLGFKGSRGQFVDLDNDSIAETIVLRQTLPSTDLAAQALGASPLVPEESTNFSAGITLNTDNGLTLTLDAYQIDIDDRIVLSAQFNRGDARAALGGGTIGDQVSILLDSAGIGPAIDGANYFTNAIDSRSRGIDLVATYTLQTDYGDFDFNGAFNYNDLEIQSIDDNPEELAALVLADGEPLQQFDRARLGTYTDEIPQTKLVFSTNFTRGAFDFLLRATQFGSFKNVTNNPAADSDNSAEFVFDVQMSYEFQNGITLSAGSNNVFNTYPDVVRPEGNFGGGQYDGNSPFGFTGGTWFVNGRYGW